MSGALYDPREHGYLKPEKPKFFLDKKNIFAAMGLVGKLDPALALKIMKDETPEIQGGAQWTVR